MAFERTLTPPYWADLAIDNPAHGMHGYRPTQHAEREFWHSVIEKVDAEDDVLIAEAVKEMLQPWYETWQPTGQQSGPKPERAEPARKRALAAIATSQVIRELMYPGSTAATPINTPSAALEMVDIFCIDMYADPNVSDFEYRIGLDPRSAERLVNDSDRGPAETRWYRKDNLYVRSSQLGSMSWQLLEKIDADTIARPEITIVAPFMASTSMQMR